MGKHPTLRTPYLSEGPQVRAGRVTHSQEALRAPARHKGSVTGHGHTNSGPAVAQCRAVAHCCRAEHMTTQRSDASKE